MIRLPADAFSLSESLISPPERLAARRISWHCRNRNRGRQREIRPTAMDNPAEHVHYVRTLFLGDAGSVTGTHSNRVQPGS